jgi:hypothetical protein
MLLGGKPSSIAARLIRTYELRAPEKPFGRSLVQIMGPQPPAGEQADRLRDPDLNPCFTHDHVFTKCLSSCALTATSATARHSHMPPLTFPAHSLGRIRSPMCSGGEEDQTLQGRVALGLRAGGRVRGLAHGDGLAPHRARCQPPPPPSAPATGGYSRRLCCAPWSRPVHRRCARRGDVGANQPGFGWCKRARRFSIPGARRHLSWSR